MILALDAHYDSSGASGCAAAVTFASWSDPAPLAEALRVQRPVASYVSGEFYRRELPCILPLALELLGGSAPIETIVVDGYVDLGARGPGLGRRLFETLDGRVEVVGVAKTRFAGAPAVPVYRARSRRPLWVSSTTDSGSSAACVQRMHGTARIPTLLRRVDELARGGLTSSGAPVA